MYLSIFTDFNHYAFHTFFAFSIPIDEKLTSSQETSLH